MADTLASRVPLHLHLYQFLFQFLPTRAPLGNCDIEVYHPIERKPKCSWLMDQTYSIPLTTHDYQSLAFSQKLYSCLLCASLGQQMEAGLASKVCAAQCAYVCFWPSLG